MNYQKYEDIWVALNNHDLEKINLSNNFIDEDLKFTKIERYFEKNTPLKFINLKKLKEEQITYLLEKKILLRYLIKNFKKSINGDGDNISRNPRQFQIVAIKDKCIYAICPFSGTIIKSNKSIFIFEDCVFYRFVSQEVFYLITTNLSSGFKKGAFYFPKHQLIIRADEQPCGLRRQHIARFKALLVSNFQEIYSYFSNINPPEKIATIIGNNNFAHHIWNELSGLYRLYKSDLMSRVDKLFVLRETLGEINQIFPEITPDKIERIEPRKNNMNASEIQLKIFQDTIRNNYFVVQVGDCVIKNGLVNRVYQVAVNNCSSDVFEQVKQARSKHFPLLWISIRLGDRTWVNQVDGFSNIINSLADKFPNLGVVFDGFSWEADSYLLSNQSQSELKLVKYQQEIVIQIIQRISNLNIGVFNTVGFSIWESNIWANAIDLYLAHHGTIQHKVGWLANKPGIVHSNTRVLKGNNDYVTNSRESGIKPIYISPIHVTDIKLEKNDFRGNLDNYDIDWKILENEVFKLAKSIEKRKTLTGKFLSHGENLFRNPSIVAKEIKNKIKQILRNIIRSLDFSKI